MRKAKIVCTIGPASESPELLDRLIEGGMNAARLNFSHGTHESHGKAIAAVRAAAVRRHAAVAIIQDLQGPRIRVGDLGRDGVTVEPDRMVTLTAERGAVATAGHIPVTYPAFARDVKPGARILINDGLIELVAERISGDTVACRVVAGGHITSNKGINLPGTSISAPTVTDKDRDDLRFGLAQDVDYVALSFVRGPEDIVAAKQLIRASGGQTPVIAKIERAEAVASLEAILDEADGVMIARGDLGVEMGPEAVPLLQKRIVREANRRRRLVITATQMLESMTQHPRPTRAEASDVANAVFDGTDAVMLSAETAAGRYPVESVQFMDRVVRAAEAGMTEAMAPAAGPSEATGKGKNAARAVPEAMCEAAASAAEAVDAGAVVVFSESGATARLMSKQRPAAPIVAFTPFEPVRHRLALYWGVVPGTMAHIAQPDERVREVERRLKQERLVKPGDRVVILSGTVSGQPGGTNSMKLHEVGS
jgi:pyruvate kinase